MEPEFRPSPLALTVLALLAVGPLHPYGIQRLVKDWGKDQVVNVGNRANLYKTIRRLNEAGLVRVRTTEKAQLYPERTVYELTEAGRQASAEWLVDMIARPRKEYPDFPAALSFLMMLGPVEARRVLAKRLELLEAESAAVERTLSEMAAVLPRITLIEDEYRRAVLGAEISWLASVIADLESGRLDWSDDLLGTAMDASSEWLPAGDHRENPGDGPYV